MSEKRNLTGLYALVTAGFWMHFCIVVSYAAVYLKSLGYSNTELGLVLAVGNVLGAALGPAMSAQIDRHARLSPYSFLPFVLIAQAIAQLLLSRLFAKSPLASAIYVVYMALALSVNSLNLKLYVDLGFSGAKVDYGLARGIGSLSFVVISMALGALIKRLSVGILPYAGLVVTALQVFFSLLLRRACPEKSGGAADAGESRSLFTFLLENKRFSVLLLGTILLFFSHNTIVNFFINLSVNAGGDAATMGYLNAAMAFVEIPVIMFYEKLRGRHSHASALRTAFVFFVLKAIAFAFAGSVPLLYVAVLFQAPSFALYTAAIVDYVDEELPHADSAKAQSLAFSMTTAGSVLASVLSGWNYDHYSVRTTLLIGAVVCAVGAVTAITGLEKKTAVKS